jgi:hypothetical protein
VQLEYWGKVLSDQAAVLHEFHALDYEIEIDCFIKWGPVVLFHLAPELLSILGELHVEVSFGVYSYTGLSDEQETEG